VVGTVSSQEEKYMSTIAAIQNETFQNLLIDLNIPAYEPSANTLALITAESRFIKDLKINTGNVLNNNQHLSRKESLLLALAVAVNEKFPLLQESFTGLAKTAGASDAEIAETIACTSLMNTNNIFYRFRHFIKKDFYENQPAGIKMSIMVNPALGKEFFELLSLVVSSINGCELCVSSHEKSVLQHGSTESRVLEAVKLGAVLKGLITILS
jgi:lipoyl-dependent peroxiredoxin subunit D